MNHPIDPRLAGLELVRLSAQARAVPGRHDGQAESATGWQDQWRRAQTEQAPPGRPAPRLGEPGLPGLRPAPLGAATPLDAARAALAGALRPSQHLAGSPRSGLRLHAQWLDDGLHLWIGADADALIQVPAFVQDTLDHCSRIGLQVVQITCNGRRLYPAASGNDFNGEL